MNWENATHYLIYRHCIGQSCREYRVRAHIIKPMPDGVRLKVKTFGNMWKGSEAVTRTAYVSADRVNPL